MTPHHYHGAESGESEEAFAQRCADELERLILAEGPDTVAAMFAEPVMGAGGAIVLASDPESELAERNLKAQSVLGAWQ